MKLLKQLLLCVLVTVGLVSGVHALDYWTGGAGIESRENAPSGYTTTFEFFARDGAYLSGIEVTLSVLDAETLLETVTSGPWLAVNLEDGHYRIEATRPSTGETQRVRFQVTAGQAQVLGLRYLQ